MNKIKIPTVPAQNTALCSVHMPIQIVTDFLNGLSKSILVKSPDEMTKIPKILSIASCYGNYEANGKDSNSNMSLLTLIDLYHSTV
jgi:hypothetical protein